jgi:hypothetical protein
VRITIRLRETRDRDLIDWISTLSEGDRSDIIRSTLRSGISNKRVNVATGPEIKIEPRAAKLDEIEEVDLDERLNDWI